MVGGIVIEVVTILDDKVYINCRDKQYKQSCGIYVEKNENSEKVEIGDTVWWQSGYAMWTPANHKNVCVGGRSGIDYDIKIPKIGFSSKIGFCT